MSQNKIEGPETRGSHVTPGTRQRVVQRNKRRVAIRLEEVFWAQLEDCARADGRKFSDLLFEIMDGAGDAVNRTARLRVFCIQWLRQRLKNFAQSAGNADLQNILAACPVPCVIMTREKAIIAYNSAFVHGIISRLASDQDGGGRTNALTFKLETPLETIHSELLEGKERFFNTKAAFVRSDKIIRTGVRFCLLEVEKSNKSSLLCFIIRS